MAFWHLLLVELSTAIFAIGAANMETEKLSKDQVKRAAEALLKHLQVEKSQKQAKSLIEDESDEIISLMIALQKIPKHNQTKPIRMYVLCFLDWRL